MGKWSQVKCNCPNRVPVAGGFYKRVYECGHKRGMLFQIWPGNLFDVGRLLKDMFRHDPEYAKSFSTFIKIARFENYDDEYLELNGEERELWQLEIEELFAFIEGRTFLPYQAAQMWNAYWAEFFTGEWHQKDAVSVENILQTGLKLCEASRETDNPIELYL